MSTADSLAGRLLCASACTYSIRDSGQLDVASPYFAGAGFDERTQVVCGGRREIHAALVGRTPDGIVIAMRGTLRLRLGSTASVIDWLNNFDFRTKQVEGLSGAVHSGFAEALESLWQPVVEALAAQFRPGDRLYLTGHSKGGAVATLAAARLSREQPLAALEVVTFGAPRCGDRAFASDYDARVRHTRYEYQDDLAPLVPPSPLLARLLRQRDAAAHPDEKGSRWSYAPVGTLRFIDWNGDIVTPDAHLQRRRVRHLAKLLLQGQVEKILRDHEPFRDYGYMRTLCPNGIGPRSPA